MKRSHGARVPTSAAGKYSGPAGARGEGGSSALGLMLAIAAVLCVSLVVLEFMRVFSIRQSVEVELSRAVNTAVNLSMSDAFRQDRLSSLDSGKARESFYQYLSENMGVADDFNIYGRDGGVACSVRVESLAISEQPPRVEARIEVSVRPAFLGRFYPGDITFSVRESSVNRRKDG
ncbi:MAG: hypothetical protein LBJ10_10720 [Clostridiales bacterium]|jgi:hypothetical protein|nr:hypothetical protein [Clostridiales bacterium]